MNRTTTRRNGLAGPLLALLTLALLTPGAVRAQTSYKLQPIVKSGDKIANVQIKAGGDLELGALNDAGQVAFVTENGNPEGSEMLLQYDNGQFIPIVVAGRAAPAPGGKWPDAVGVYSPVRMNQLGNLVFATVDGEGTYLWDAKTQKVTPIALKGMPAANNLTFETGGEDFPAINNSNEVALVAGVKNAAGGVAPGVFFLGRDSKLLPVALPDQELPGGAKVIRALLSSINDAGVVSVSVQRSGDVGYSAFIWENGTLTPLAVAGTELPGGFKFDQIGRAWVNNKNRNVSMIGWTGDKKGLYLFTNGKFQPVAAPGQEMPDGGKLQTIYNTGTIPALNYVSSPNDAGQQAFVARLDDGSRAVYLADADGKLSLILKQGATTDAGKITNIGLAGTVPGSFGVGLNNKGQIALTVQIDDGPATIVLLTPKSPAP
jgi:hypothetical protein